MSSPSSSIPLWPPRSEQAREIATLLRGAPLTLLIGDSGVGKTTLLVHGVMPLLRRRLVDLQTDGWQIARPGAHSPERRHEAQRQREIALYVDTWTDAVRDALRRRVDASTAPSAERAESAPRSHWLLIFDRYEEHLQQSDDRESVRAFDAWLLRAVSAPVPQVHVLVALQSDAEPLMQARYFERLAQLDQHYLRLLPASQVVLTPPPAERRPPPKMPDPPPAEPPPPAAAAPVHVAYAPTLPLPRHPAYAPTLPLPRAQLRPPEPFEATRVVTGRAPAVSAGAAAADDDLTDDEAGSGGPKTGAYVVPLPQHWEVPEVVESRGMRIARLAALPVYLLIAASTAWWVFGVPVADVATMAGLSRAPAPVAAAPSRAADIDEPAAAGLLPAWKLWGATDDGQRSPLADDLMQRVAPAAGLSLTTEVNRGGAAALAELKGPGQLAIVRQDALRVARERPAQPPLQLVMSLYSEEIYLLVRSDSPLRYLHQIRGQVVNIGPIEGPRALSIQMLYRTLYGAPMPLSPPALLDRDTALASLMAGGPVQVLALVGAQPHTWLAGLDLATVDALRLLTVDARHASTRRLRGIYQTSLLRAQDHPGWLQYDLPALSIQSYLVAPEPADMTQALQVGDLARTLCRTLPALQLTGHPKWGEVDPAGRNDVDWPYASIAAGAIGACLAAAEDGPRR